MQLRATSLPKKLNIRARSSNKLAPKIGLLLEAGPFEDGPESLYFQMMLLKFRKSIYRNRPHKANTYENRFSEVIDFGGPL